MKLTCNQKIVLLLFIIAIVSVVFMEYTREYVENVVKDNGVTPQSSTQPSTQETTQPSLLHNLNTAVTHFSQGNISGAAHTLINVIS